MFLLPGAKWIHTSCVVVRIDNTRLRVFEKLSPLPHNILLTITCCDDIPVLWHSLCHSLATRTLRGEMHVQPRPTISFKMQPPLV